MDEATDVTAAEVDSDDTDALVEDLDPGAGAESVVGGRAGGDPCDGSEFHKG